MTRTMLVLFAAVFFLGAAGCKKKEKPAPPKQPVAPAAKAPAAKAPAAKPEATAAVQTAGSPEVKVGQKAKCPVSKETFTVSAKTPHFTHAGKKFYLCCEKCKKPFAKDPAKFLKSS